jgi:hypothetical protein
MLPFRINNKTNIQRRYIMALFKVKRDVKEVEEFKGGDGGKFLNKPGVYDITILASIFNQAKDSESASLDFYIEHDGQKQPLYGNIILLKKDGSENESGMKLLNKLCVIADIDEISDPEEATLPIGKDGANKDVAILPELSDIDVKVRLGIEYGAYNGSITERKVIKTFYRASDGATAEEILFEEQGKDVELGAQYKKDLEYMEQNPESGYKYNDGITKEQVEEWIKNKRPKNTLGGASTSGTVKKPSFGKKRFGK